MFQIDRTDFQFSGWRWETGLTVSTQVTGFVFFILLSFLILLPRWTVVGSYPAAAAAKIPLRSADILPQIPGVAKRKGQNIVARFSNRGDNRLLDLWTVWCGHQHRTFVHGTGREDNISVAAVLGQVAFQNDQTIELFVSFPPGVAVRIA